MNYEKLPKTISAEELLSTPLPPVKWIIPDLLPAGLALFAGPSKAGKSWLTLWLCLQVAQGKPMWGREIEPHTVLYLSLEDTFNRLQKRLLQLVGSEEAPERLVMQTEYNQKICGNCYNQKYLGYVFVDAMGNLIQPDSVTTGFPQLLKENGLRRIRFHDLRHSCASLLLKEGVPMKQIQEWLGHSDISTTANIYAHLDSQSKNLSARTMANTLTLPEAQPIKKW